MTMIQANADAGRLLRGATIKATIQKRSSTAHNSYTGQARGDGYRSDRARRQAPSDNEVKVVP